MTKPSKETCCDIVEKFMFKPAIRPLVDEMKTVCVCFCVFLCVCFSAAGVSQRSEEAAGGKRQTEERHRAAENSAAGKTEETHR